MLSILIWLPILGAIIIGLTPPAVSSKTLRLGALTISGLTLLWTLWLMAQYNPDQSGMQFQELLLWLPNLGLNYELGVDGLALPMVILNSTLIWIAIYCTSADQPRPRLFYSLVLVVGGAMAGAFLAQNLLLFFLLYEVPLVPFYLLVSIWGGGERNQAAIKFLLYTAVSGALILAAFLGIIWLSGNSSFHYDASLTQSIPLEMQVVLLALVLIGFGIKIPLVPFHTWLPDTYVSASTPIAMLLGGVLAKLGTYGLFRFGLGLFPQAWSQLAPSLAIWAAISIVYGAMTAIAQKDIKRMVAYSSIGHMGYILLAGAALTPLSMVGAVSQMAAHGLILALLFHLVGIVESKVGTRELDVLNGLMNPVRGLPLTAGLLVLAGMASAGIPGLVGFIAEFMIFQGCFAEFPIETILAVIGTGLTAVYFVILLNRTCFGKLDNAIAYFPKVVGSERTPALILSALVIVLGIQPNWLVRWSEATSTALIAAVPLTQTQQIALNPKVPLSQDFSSIPRID